MNNLKELTWKHHQNAERQDFVKVLLSGKIHPDFYATFLWNQRQKYDLLESYAETLGILSDLAEIKRAHKIANDFFELWGRERSFPPTLPSTFKYIDRLEEIKNNKDAIIAHIYVHHMGDLSGGQLIKKRVPGSGTLYQFNGKVDDLKEKIRALTNDDMAEEAKWVFDCATELFQDMMEVDCERYLEQSDTVSE